MTEYNIASFAPIMQSGLTIHNTQETAVRFLLSSISCDDYIDLSAKMITNLVKRKAEVVETIKKTATRPEVIAAAIDYFKSEVVPDLNPHLLDDTCTKILKLLDLDPSVPTAKRDQLASLYKTEKVGEFLALSFLYALSRANKKKAASLEVDDITLLNEVHNKCPLCRASLVKSVKGQSRRKYTITKIYHDHFPEVFQETRTPVKKLDANDNLIALCQDCASDYLLDTELEEYIMLFDLKRQYVSSFLLRQELDNMSLEDEIVDVIRALGTIQHVNQLQELSLNMLTLSQKILPENVILLDDITTDVLKYYRFIQDCFSHSNSFELIASEIKATFYKLEKFCSTQDEIVDRLAQWILEQTKMPDQHLRACRIIVSFFVQNCEVFYEITQ